MGGPGNHIAKIAGVDHVGIGSDFDGVPVVPRGLEDDVSKIPNLTAACSHEAYSDDGIKKIMGGNFLRVIRAVVGY